MCSDIFHFMSTALVKTLLLYSYMGACGDDMRAKLIPGISLQMATECNARTLLSLAGIAGEQGNNSISSSALISFPAVPLELYFLFNCLWQFREGIRLLFWELSLINNLLFCTVLFLSPSFNFCGFVM